MEKYSEKYKDPRWQKKRLKILERDKWTCQNCLDTKSTLHVHHRYYVRGKKIWDYPDNAFITLCEDCHLYETERIDDAIKLLESAFREHFLSSDIDDIACSVGSMKLLHMPGIVASTYSWAFRNPIIQKELIDRYIKNQQEIIEQDIKIKEARKPKNGQ